MATTEENLSILKDSRGREVALKEVKVSVIKAGSTAMLRPARPMNRHGGFSRNA